jgi:3',5'-cyclic AMP phosphodiesterase CpdA
MKKIIAAIFVSLVAFSSAEDEPIATFAVISNPYITTLPPDEIIDENGRVRDFLAKTTGPALEKTVSIVNQLKPDALIILGSATWSGSQADFTVFKGYLDRVEVPALVVPASRDALSADSAGWRKELGEMDATDSVRQIAGVSLIFSSDLHTAPDDACARIAAQSAAAGETGAKAALLFCAHPPVGRSLRKPDHAAFWPLVEKLQIAAEFESVRYGYNLSLTNSLPGYKVGSTGWSTRGAITRIRVFEERIEISQFSDPEKMTFSLTIPNPVAAPRLTAAEADPSGCLTYTAELAKKPDFTVALISDPQFDRERSRQTLINLAEAGIADLNRLKPDLVFITGDLVNNNLPEEWDLFNSIFAKLESKRVDLPGNHDVLFNYDFVEASYSKAPTDKPEYKKLVDQALVEAKKEGFEGPTALFEKYTGSPPRQRVEIGDSAFITIPFLTTRADAEQVEYLRKELEACADKRFVFVAAHYPALPVFGNNLLPNAGGSEVLSMLIEHKVAGFLFGHRHRNGFAMFESTAHILTDNMSSIHLLHVHDDHIVLGRKRIGASLYETLTISNPRS